MLARSAAQPSPRSDSSSPTSRVPPSRPSKPSPTALLRRASPRPLQSGPSDAGMPWEQYPHLPASGTLRGPGSASPSPRAREGTVGAESKPQCSVHCCIMTLFMGWVENSVGETVELFL